MVGCWPEGRHFNESAGVHVVIEHNNSSASEVYNFAQVKFSMVNLGLFVTILLAAPLAQAQQPPKLKGGARSLKVREAQTARRATPDRPSSSAAQVHGKYCSNPANAESFVCIKHNMRADLQKASKDDQLKIKMKLGKFTAADRRGAAS